ncbi:MAG: class I SAM-dependent methyltransferase [Candidatus Saccharimonadales bacterium]
MTHKESEGLDYRNKFSSENAQKYETSTYKNNSYYSLMWKIEKKYLQELLNGRQFDNYLDFACGSGRVIEFTENYADKSTGVDVSADMLKLARSKIKKSKLIQQDLTQESLAAQENFDLITAFRFFLNAQSELREEVADEFAKITDKGSTVIISNQGNKTSFISITALIEEALTGRKLNKMSLSDFKQLFESHGFKLVEYRGIGFLPKIFYNITFLKKIWFFIDLFFYRLRIFSYFSHNQIMVFEKL